MNIDNLLPNELKELIDKLKLKLNDDENSKNTIAKIADRERQKNTCPKCGKSHVVKDGLYKGRQKYKCKDCGKKFNSLTATPFHHTRLNYKQIETAYQCLVDKIPLRKAAEKIGVSLYTAFVLRFKLISCLKLNKGATLSRNVELDEYYVSINLKGTKKDKMPRASKKRKKHGTGKQGINHHQVCITSGVDDSDNVFFEVAGTGSVTTDMINDTVVNEIQNSTKIITDCKSSYERCAKDNHWNLKQVKSSSYKDSEGNTLANINSLHSQLANFLSTFHGVSTKHLQQYLDWFVFSKYQTYHVEYLNQINDFEKNTIIISTSIKYGNVCNNYSIFDFNDVYSDYMHPSNSIT